MCASCRIFGWRAYKVLIRILKNLIIFKTRIMSKNEITSLFVLCISQQDAGKLQK